MDPSRLSTRSSLTDELENTPDISRKLSPLSSEISQAKPAPQSAGAFLRWRLEVLNHEMRYFEVAELAVMEAGKADAFLSSIKNELSTLEAQKIVLLEQNRFIAEGLEDATKAVGDAYLEELEYACANASRNGAAVTRSKAFKNKVAVYLNSVKPNSMHKLYYCNVLGKYLASSAESLGIKCAPIVPFSFETTQLAYMFGTEEAALRSPRNGLMLASPIEEAFDNGEIAIVPCGSLDDNPTEWKVIVLHTGLLDKPCWEDPSTGEKTMWNVSPSRIKRPLTRIQSNSLVGNPQQAARMAKQQPPCSPIPVLAIRIDVVGRSLQGISRLAGKFARGHNHVGDAG